MDKADDADAAEGTSVYVHVPFCVVKCGYCDFNSYEVDDRSVLDRFLDALDVELDRSTLPRRPASVFVGGGTPTFLDAPRFERLWSILGRHLDLARVGEVSVEANPESLTRQKAEIARAAGATRFSVGVQSLDAARLRFLDRAHGPEEVAAAVEALRAAGVDNLSLDLMFAIPGQTLEQWQSDLEGALALDPDHLSAYALIFEPGTRLTHRQRRGEVDALDDEIERDMFLWTRQRLGDAGFDAYEISNFAGRGGPCRHNDHYWLQGDYVGVGPGAASHRAGVRTTNLKPVDAWARAVHATGCGTGSAETLTPDQRFGEALWLGLRRTAGLDLGQIERRLAWPIPAPCAEALERFVRQGLVERNDARIRLTRDGILHADTVGESLLVAV